MGFKKIVQSGNQLEIYEYSKELNINRNVVRTKRAGKRNNRFRTMRVDNVRRKIKSFCRLVKANCIGDQNPSLFTLTMFENLGIKLSYASFTLFTKRLRIDTKIDFRYIAVPEFQKRGAVHFHVLIWGLNEYAKKERDNRYIQNCWARGYVDCIPTDGNPKLASYLSKYMRKSMQDQRLCGQKAYTASRNVLRPLSLSFSSPIDYAKDLWGIDLSTGVDCLHERNFSTQWLGKGRYRLFDLSNVKNENSHHT